MGDELDELRSFKYRESRIPKLPALETFVPRGEEDDPTLNEIRGRTGFSRWFPEEGGHRVLIFYQGGPYDATRFTLLPDAWDHEHCTRCRSRIEAMTLCWVSESGRYILLCEDCHRLVMRSQT